MSCQRTPPISIDNARDLLIDSIIPVKETEVISLDQTLGRVAGETLVSKIDLPSTQNAAVDGYGVHSDRLSKAPDQAFKIVGISRAGHPFDGIIGEDEAIEIYTGGVMPMGADCVAMHEDCSRDGNKLFVSATLTEGSNIRLAGENLAKGETLVAKGQMITAALIGQLAASGTTRLAVLRRIRVAILSTGDEIVASGGSATSGQIFDANRPMLKALLQHNHIDLIDCGIVPDRVDALAEVYEQALQDADMVISSGGASDGIEDHTQNAMKQIGAECVFWRLAMKPGRPMAVGRRDKGLIFCLPGNPVAAFVCTRLLILPFLGRASGGVWQPALKIALPSGFVHSKKPGRAEFLRVVLENNDGKQQLLLHGRKGAGVISSLTGADGLVEIPLDNAGVEVGTLLYFLPFHERGL